MLDIQLLSNGGSLWRSCIVLSIDGCYFEQSNAILLHNDKHIEPSILNRHTDNRTTHLQTPNHSKIVVVPNSYSFRPIRCKIKQIVFGGGCERNQSKLIEHYLFLFLRLKGGEIIISNQNRVEFALCYDGKHLVVGIVVYCKGEVLRLELFI